MPSNNLQDFQAEIVLAYLRSIATSGRTVSGNGDAARGKAIFEGKGNCASCHRVNGVGSRVGPDLTKSRRAAAQAESTLWHRFDVPDAGRNRTYKVGGQARSKPSVRTYSNQRMKIPYHANTGCEGRPASSRETGSARTLTVDSRRNRPCLPTQATSHQELDDLVAYLLLTERKAEAP